MSKTAPEKPIAQVALDLPIAQHFDFLAGDATELDIGKIVIVPFGKKHVAGVLVALAETSDVAANKLKSIAHVQRVWPGFSAADMALLRFCEGYYHHPFGAIALNSVPTLMRSGKPSAIAPTTQKVIAMTPEGLTSWQMLPARMAAQRALLTALSDGPRELASLAPRLRTKAVVEALAEKGWIALLEKEANDSATADSTHRPLPRFKVGPALTEEQRIAVAEINAQAGQFAPMLLAGITGSGKTETYLNAIAHTLTRGQQALVLVPEINLTPQFLKQIQQRFPDANIVAQHSAMAASTRLAGYLAAQRGDAHIVIGTRLAVFTPLPRLGLIVVDEEHDASFKQQEGFRYSARDVAIFRAQQAQCPVVLGSATPSLETLQNVSRGRFKALTLRARAVGTARLPKIEFINLKTERAVDGLTQTLIDAIEATIARGEQSLIFINRRGFSPALVCSQCGHVPHCTRCAARLVFHQADKRLRCHHCGFQSRVPSACADCGSAELVPAGQGAERIEAALRSWLRSARIARVDRDSTRKRGAAEAIFDAASRGEVDVLVGTQMLAKGHDFPRLTLVGVINADGAMFSADFRASERMAAQLMQVAGRAGRAALTGRVLIQTRFVDHPLYRAVAGQDYDAFARLVMAERQLANLPPYAYLALLRAEAKLTEAVEAFMEKATQRAVHCRKQAGLNDDIQIWDPVPAQLARKGGFERRQLMVQSHQRSGLQKFLAAWIVELREHAPNAVKWSLDIDPMNL